MFTMNFHCKHKIGFIDLREIMRDGTRTNIETVTVTSREDASTETEYIQPWDRHLCMTRRLLSGEEREEVVDSACKTRGS